MAVTTDISVTVNSNTPLGDGTHAWLFGGNAADDPQDDFSNALVSIALDEAVIVPQAAFGAFTHIYARVVNQAMPAIVDLTGEAYNASGPTGWVELPTGPTALWLDTFTDTDAVLITAHTAETGGAYTAVAKSGSPVMRIESNRLRAADNNDSWATQAAGTTGQINRVRGLIPNDTGTTAHQGIVVIWSSANTNGLDGYGARVNYLNGSFDIVQLTDGAVSTLGTPGSGAYTGDDGNAFWLQIRGYDNGGTPTLVARIIRASDEVVTGEITHALSPGSLPTGNAGLWFTNGAGRFDAVEGYAD